MTDVDKAQLHAERQQQQQQAKEAKKAQNLERAQQLQEASAEKKSARQARHQELLREQATRKEEKLREKALRREASDQKIAGDIKRRIEKQHRELSVNVDIKALKDAVNDQFNKIGKVEKTEVAFSGSKLWNFSVTFEKKDDVKKALQRPIIQLPVNFVLEQLPIPEHSVNFPYIWAEIKDSAWRPAGQPWEELKKEIIRVFGAKTPTAKPSFVSYKSRRVVVTYESTTARDLAVAATAEGKNHQWLVQGKPIPSLTPSIPKFTGKSKKRKAAQASVPGGVDPSKIQRVA